MKKSHLHLSRESFGSPDRLFGHSLRLHRLLPDNPHALGRHPLAVGHLLPHVVVARLVSLAHLLPNDGLPKPFSSRVQLVDAQRLLALFSLLLRHRRRQDLGEALVVDAERVLGRVLQLGLRDFLLLPDFWGPRLGRFWSLVAIEYQLKKQGKVLIGASTKGD